MSRYFTVTKEVFFSCLMDCSGKQYLPCATGSAAACRETGWREDLEASRDVGEREKPGYGFVLSWLESWERMRGRRRDGRRRASSGGGRSKRSRARTGFVGGALAEAAWVNGVRSSGQVSGFSGPGTPSSISVHLPSKTTLARVLTKASYRSSADAATQPADSSRIGVIPQDQGGFVR